MGARLNQRFIFYLVLSIYDYRNLKRNRILDIVSGEILAEALRETCPTTKGLFLLRRSVLHTLLLLRLN